MTIKNFDYDELTDSLFISRKKEGEKVQGSAEIGNLILDFTNEGRIAGAELSGISNLMKMMNFSPTMLTDLTEA